MDLDSIKIMFNIPTEMSVFSWDGEIDTVMTPMDSIRYYKYFLQTGFMSMDPHTGYVIVSSMIVSCFLGKHLIDFPKDYLGVKNID